MKINFNRFRILNCKKNLKTFFVNQAFISLDFIKCSDLPRFMHTQIKMSKQPAASTFRSPKYFEFIGQTDRTEIVIPKPLLLKGLYNLQATIWTVGGGPGPGRMLSKRLPQPIRMNGQGTMQLDSYQIKLQIIIFWFLF